MGMHKADGSAHKGCFTGYLDDSPFPEGSWDNNGE